MSARRIPVSSAHFRSLSGLDPEEIFEKYEAVTLAEIYAAIATPLATHEEITAEIEQEDRIEVEARRRGQQAQPVSA